MSKIKKLQILAASLLSVTIYAQTASALSVEDSRDTNLPPNQYVGHLLKAEFKQRSLIGSPGDGYYAGLITFTPWMDNSGDSHHQLSFTESGIFYRKGMPESTQWDPWRQIIMADPSGNLGVGNSAPQYRLDVNGSIRAGSSAAEGGALVLTNTAKIATPAAYNWVIYNMGGAYGNSLQFWNYSSDNSQYGAKLIISDTGNVSVPVGKLEAKELKVSTTPTADFVFDKDYQLPDLGDTEKYIAKNHHLAEIPSAEEMAKDGVNVGEFQIRLLRKIEELTLYCIGLEKQNRRLSEKLERQGIEVHQMQKAAVLEN